MIQNPFLNRAALAAALCASTCWLAACAQPLLPDPAASTCARSPAAADALRVVVAFRQPVEGASPAVLTRLQQQGGACAATFVSSVSSTVHTYSFAGVGDPARLRQNLLSWPLVQAVEVDQKTSPR